MSQATNSGTTSRQLPLWALSPKEEKQAYANFKKAAYKECDDAVREFSLCAKNAGVSVTFSCRDTHKKMYSCLESYQTYENLDHERAKVIAEKKRKFVEEQEQKLQQKA